MLTLLTGLPGSGKTTQIFRKIAENGTYRQQYCLVPEAQLHAMQRRLCQSCGNAASLYAQVLTLPKLADALIREDSTAAGEQLTQAQRLLHMHQAMEAAAPRLQLYASYCHRPAFLQRVLATLGTLESCCVEPASLLALAEKPDFSQRLRMKLGDLGQILGEYRAGTAQALTNRQDRLTYLLQLLRSSACLAEADVYLLGFLSFTPQEMEILQEICKQAHSLTIALLWTDSAQAVEFRPAQAAMQALRDFAARATIPYRVEALPAAAGSAPLPWLRENWCSQANAAWDAPTEDIVLFTGESTLEQAEFAAQTIRQLLGQGWRYRQIGLAVRGVQSWAEELAPVFRGYGIALQLPGAAAALTQPLLVGVSSALEAAADGFRPNDILRYLKSGILPIPEAELCSLEHYVHTWRIQGETWTRSAAWSWHPKGYGERWHAKEREQVAALDQLRRQLMAPFAALRAGEAATGADWAQRLYAFLQAIALPDALADREDTGEAEAAAWELLCETLEGCAQGLAQSVLSLREFSSLFVSLLRQASGTAARQTLDQVQLFEATQPTGQAVDCLLVLGAESHAFPQVASGAGLFTNQDLECLAECLPTMTTADHAAQQELAALYRLVTLPRQKLVVCHSAYNAEGTAQQPSILLTRLARLFPHCRRAQPSANAPESAAAVLPQEQLSPALVQQLYGRIPTFSASSIDTFQGCHFAYFMQNGLRAKAQEVASFGSNNIGSYYHYILEKVLQETAGQGSLRALPQEQLMEIARQKAAEYEAQLQLEDASRETNCIVQRSRKDLEKIIQNVAEEIQKSDFAPTAFELRFGPGADSKIHCSIQAGEHPLQLSGYVDRVDTWEHDGKTYYRIIDYKSNGKDIAFEKLWEGIGLQMLIYLFAIESAGMGKGPDEGLRPAGVLYLPLSHVIIAEKDIQPGKTQKATADPAQPETSIDSEKLQKKIASELLRKGLLLDEEALLNAMEHCSADESRRFIDDRPQSRITSEQLALLRQHVQAIYAELAQNLAAGKVAPNPYYISDYANACKYCDYAAACQFTPGQHGLDYRYMTTMKAEAFWGRLAGKYGEADAAARA